MNRRKFLSGLAAAPAVAIGAVGVAKAAPDPIDIRRAKAVEILNMRVPLETADDYGDRIGISWSGAQWTPEQIAVLKRHNRPTVTFNRLPKHD